jgi:hypothetical protein
MIVLYHSVRDMYLVNFIFESICLIIFIPELSTNVHSMDPKFSEDDSRMWNKP